jgi:hypothetical protein
MRLGAIMLAIALTVVAPSAARAQVNPLQAMGIAESMARIVFGSMYPAPQCGPHDALPQPYQPPPHYAPPPRPDQHANLDDNDDYNDPIQPRSSRRFGTYSLQPQPRPEAEDDTDQTTGLRARDAGQPADQPGVSDDGGQPVAAHVRRRSARPKRPAQTIVQTQSAGQVAEIPSLPRAAQAPSDSEQ